MVRLYEIAPSRSGDFQSPNLVGMRLVTSISIFSCIVVRETIMFRLQGTKQSSKDVAHYIQQIQKECLIDLLKLKTQKYLLY